MNSKRLTWTVCVAALTWACVESPEGALAPSLDMGGMGRPAVLVNPDGNGNGTARTIQEGIDMVGDGGRVMVLPGTYEEALVIDKRLTLEAVGAESGPVVVAPTTAPVAVITVVTEEAVAIRGLTIQGGTIGIRFNGVAANLTVERTLVRGLTSGALGGITSVWAAPPGAGPARLVVRDSRIEGDAVRPSSGISAQGDVDVVLERNIVRRTATRCINIAFGATAFVTTTADVMHNDLDECGIASGIAVTTNGPKTGVRTANVVGNIIRNSGGELVRNGIYYEGFAGRIEHNSIVGVVLPSANPNQENLAGCCVVVPAGIFVGTFRAAPNANVTVQFNDVTGNAFAGLRVQQATSVTATCTWWGAASGPSGAGSGSGDAVVGPATFSPWAAAAIAGTETTGC